MNPPPLRKISLRIKLLAILAVVSALFTAGAALGLRSLTSGLAAYRTLLSSEVSDDEAALQTRALFKEQVQEWKDVLLRGHDPALLEKHWRQFGDRERDVDELAAKMEKALARRHPAEASLARQFAAAHQQLGRDYRSALEAFKAAKFDPRVGDERIRGLDREPTRLLAELSGSLEAAQRSAVAATQAIEEEARRTAVILLLGAALLSFALAGVLIALWVQRPLRRLTALAASIASGDLTQTITLTTRDEMQDLASAFSTLIARLREIPEQLSMSVEDLLAIVSGLDQGVRAQEVVIGKQAAALQETQVTAQEIRQTSVLAAEKSQAILAAARAGETLGGSGREAVDQTIQGVEQVRGEVESATERVASLRELIQKADAIALTVKDLADQSNMLALNAAIEAARSGEHGRGFAVVAREIRSLADQSIAATRSVRDLLHELDSGVSHAVEMTEKGNRNASRSLSAVRTSGETLRELLGTVQDTSAAVQQIAAAVSQQGAGVTQIFSAVSHQSEMMRETQSTVEIVAGSILKLRGVAGQMEALVSGYRL